VEENKEFISFLLHTTWHNTRAFLQSLRFFLFSKIKAIRM